MSAGETLITLDPSQSKAELGRLLARQQTLMAQKARYEAEASGSASGFTLATGTQGLQLRGATTPNIVASALPADDNAVLAEQRKEFAAGRKRFDAQMDAIAFQIETLKDQKTGLSARLLGGQQLLAMTDREIAKVKPLALEGYLPKNRLWELERRRLEQLTTNENTAAEIAATDQRIFEARANLSQLEESDREQRSEELTRVIGELAEITDQITAARTAFTLTELKAPVDGTVVKLSSNTVGGVVSPGTTIAEIVPANAKLQTEFRVPVDKVKSVYPGQKVRVTVTAFNRRTYDPIDGEVTFVSADSLTDEQTGEVYFLAKAVMKQDVAKNTGLAEISPGMATEVYALSEPRVFASYLVQPITDSFNRAFREIN